MEVEHASLFLVNKSTDCLVPLGFFSIDDISCDDVVLREDIDEALEFFDPLSDHGIRKRVPIEKGSIKFHFI